MPLFLKIILPGAPFRGLLRAWEEMLGDPVFSIRAADRTARRCLGFSESQYIIRSYGGRYLEWFAARGRCPRHMVFQ